ncbi:MAG TPA: hypothetical protein PLZ50_10365, partial [Rubrivivax sp.]|nr:hypothetical protein [Rubrivivax sp.]
MRRVQCSSAVESRPPLAATATRGALAPALGFTNDFLLDRLEPMDDGGGLDEDEDAGGLLGTQAPDEIPAS